MRIFFCDNWISIRPLDLKPFCCLSLRSTFVISRRAAAACPLARRLIFLREIVFANWVLTRMIFIAEKTKTRNKKNSAGRVSGAADGAAAGLETGFGLGREVGVYAGAAAAWEKLLLARSSGGATSASLVTTSGRDEDQKNEGEEEEEEEESSTSSLRRRRRAALASVRSLAAAVAGFKDRPREEALSDALEALRSKWCVARASVGAVAASGVGVGVGVGGGGGGRGATSAETLVATTTTFEATAGEIRGAVAAGHVGSSSPSALPSLDF